MAFSREEIEEITAWVKSPTLGKIVAQIEEKYHLAWKVAKTTDDREFCWRMTQCVHAVVSEMQAITDADRIAQHNADRPRFNANVATKAEPRDLSA